MLQLWNLQTLAAHFFGGQITLFSMKLLLDTIRLEMVAVQFSIPPLALEALAGEFVCGLLASCKKKANLLSTQVFKSALVSFYQPECCCWHFSLTANAVCVGFLLTQFI